METRIRRTLSMVSRVRDFARTHPSDDPGAAGVANTLDERLDRANALLTQQLAGQLEAHAAAVHRRELRRAIATELLPQLVRVGKALARERPELAGKFVGPPDKADLKLFTVMAKALLAEGQVEREALVSHGLLTTLLDDLGTALAEFDSVTEASHASRTAHVGARADLRRVSAELTRLVGILDGQNRQRFRRDPELKAAWRSARNVVGPFRSKPEPESPQDAASQDTAPQDTAPPQRSPEEGRAGTAP